MGTFVVKPDRDEDWYLVWSSIAEAQHCWGPRSYVFDWFDSYLRDRDPRVRREQAELELSRADELGTSSYIDRDLRFDQNGILIYQQRGMLRKDKIREFCELWTKYNDGDEAEVSPPDEEIMKYLEPFDD